VIACFGGAEFKRLKLGIGKPGQASNTVDFVLGEFTSAEHDLLDRQLDASVEAALMLCGEGCKAAMNVFNGLDLSQEPARSQQPNQE